MLQIFANIWSGIEHAYAYVKVITDKILSDSRWVQQCMRIQYVQHVLYYERVQSTTVCKTELAGGKPRQKLFPTEKKNLFKKMFYE